MSISQRRREIGIRIALGAQNGALKRKFVGRGLALAAAAAAASYVPARRAAAVDPVESLRAE